MAKQNKEQKPVLMMDDKEYQIDDLADDQKLIGFSFAPHRKRMNGKIISTRVGNCWSDAGHSMDSNSIPSKNINEEVSRD